MVEQKMEKLAAYSDRIFLMHEGKLIDSGPPAEIFSRDDLLTFGVEPPVYTTVAKALHLKNELTGLYPISLEEMPASGITSGDIQDNQ